MQIQIYIRLQQPTQDRLSMARLHNCSLVIHCIFIMINTLSQININIILHIKILKFPKLTRQCPHHLSTWGCDRITWLLYTLTYSVLCRLLCDHSFTIPGTTLQNINTWTVACLHYNTCSGSNGSYASRNLKQKPSATFSTNVIYKWMNFPFDIWMHKICWNRNNNTPSYPASCDHTPFI